MSRGVIHKALSGFYYITCDGVEYQCRGRGKLRKEGISPLVGDIADFTVTGTRDGVIDSIAQRKNSFIRPAVANIDVMVFVASGAVPVTDPFLIDRVSVIARSADIELIVCINKTDLDPARELYDIYVRSGFRTILTSAATGEGIPDLLDALRGRTGAFTGNSGVGKSSLLNALIPGLNLTTDDVSDRLGRGKHTTRHVEFFSPCPETYIADTPGFASFDIEMINNITAEELAGDFIDFLPYIPDCRFTGCRHINEPACAVIQAVEEGKIEKTRYESYCRLYDMIKDRKDWE